MIQNGSAIQGVEKMQGVIAIVFFMILIVGIMGQKSAKDKEKYRELEKRIEKLEEIARK